MKTGGFFIGLLAVACFFAWMLLVSDTGRLAIEELESTQSTLDHVKGAHDDESSSSITLQSTYDLLKPYKQLQEYISVHSLEALQKSSRKELLSRKYMVAPYNCPHQAGNVFTVFLNLLVLGIATNRTLVWTYDDRMNAEDECSALLDRANWIPSLTELLQLRGEEPQDIKVYYFKQHTQIRDACSEILNISLPGKACREKVASLPEKSSKELAVTVGNNPFFSLRGISGCHHSELRGFSGRFNLTDPTCFYYVDGLFPGELVDRETIDNLFDQGLFFLYGMLFRETFSLSPNLVDSVSTRIDENAFSVGIHARHARIDDDGSDITKQKTCLLTLMKRRKNHLLEHSLHQNPNVACQIAIMSDRVATNEALKNFSETELGCSALTVKSHRALKIEGEHGPFEGAGFFQDLILVSQARDGFISTDRSSSSLVLEAIVYGQVMRGDPVGEVCFPPCFCHSW